MFKLLNNYDQCINSTHETYRFRNGYEFSFVEKSSAEHIFKEILIGECYPLHKGNDEKKVIIDIGANIGFFTYYALIKCPNSRIISVEADPSNFIVLHQNIFINKLNSRVDLFNNIVSSSLEEKMVFYLSENPGWSSIYKARGAIDGNPIELSSINLSKLFSDNNLEVIDVLKIDVEGAEYDIIINDNFLEHHNVNEIYVEVDKHPRDSRFSFEELVSYLNQYYHKINIQSQQSEYPLIHCSRFKDR